VASLRARPAAVGRGDPTYSPGCGDESSHAHGSAARAKKKPVVTPHAKDRQPEVSIPLQKQPGQWTGFAFVRLSVHRHLTKTCAQGGRPGISGAPFSSWFPCSIGGLVYGGWGGRPAGWSRLTPATLQSRAAPPPPPDTLRAPGLRGLQKARACPGLNHIPVSAAPVFSSPSLPPAAPGWTHSRLTPSLTPPRGPPRPLLPPGPFAGRSRPSIPLRLGRSNSGVRQPLAGAGPLRPTLPGLAKEPTSVGGPTCLDF